LGFKKVRGFFNQSVRDNGGVNYLDASRRHLGQLIYNRVFYPPPISAERENISIAFSAALGSSLLACTNNMTSFDSIPRNEIVRVQSDDAKRIYEVFRERLALRSEQPQHFPQDASIHAWFDDNVLEVFEYRVRTGLFIKMTDGEVEAASRKLPPPIPKP
jgi:hypothetical protein